MYLRTITCASTYVHSGHGKQPTTSLYVCQGTLLVEGYTCSQVVTQKGILNSRQTVWRLIGHFKVHGTITPLPKSGRQTKLTDVALQKRYDAA